jgi:hypothetical protein
VIAVLAMVDISLALLGRVNAQLQLLTIAFPIKMMLALTIFGWILVLLPTIMRNDMGAALTRGERTAGSLAMAEKDQKTEQPTPRRMQKAREEGNFPSAKVFVGSIQFLAFVAMLRSWGGTWITATHDSMSQLLHHALAPDLDPAFILNLSLELIKRTFMPLAILGCVLVGVTLAAQFMVTRLGSA